jgi:hypothetical protein
MSAKLSDYFYVNEYPQPGKKVVFVFAGWKFKPFVYGPVVYDLQRRGFSCIMYTPKKQLIAIGTPYKEIVKAAGYVTRDTLQRAALHKQAGADCSILGISFGTLFAMEAAKACPDVKSIALLAPFGDFAEHVLRWPNHRFFGQVLASQPTPAVESGEILNQVGAMRNLQHLQNKRIFIGYSTSDKIIHTPVTESLITAMRKHSLKPVVQRVRGNHIGGILTHLCIQKRYITHL